MSTCLLFMGGAGSRLRHFDQAGWTRWLAGTVLLLVLWPAYVAEPQTSAYANKPDLAVLASREQLLEIFFLRKSKWANGDKIRVFVLPDRHPLHIRFVKEVLGVYPYQLRAAWDRMLYSGTGVPPTVVNTIDEMRRSVDGTSGAIGYLEQ
ncbi:MAG: hypothetical protein ACREWG_15400 [Gammaproteobacteria bacterium]